MLLKIRITIFKFTFLTSTMSIVFPSFEHLEMQINIKIFDTIQHIDYICMTVISPNSVCDLLLCKCVVV